MDKLILQIKLMGKSDIQQLIILLTNDDEYVSINASLIQKLIGNLARELRVDQRKQSASNEEMKMGEAGVLIQNMLKFTKVKKPVKGLKFLLVIHQILNKAHSCIIQPISSSFDSSQDFKLPSNLTHKNLRSAILYSLLAKYFQYLRCSYLLRVNANSNESEKIQRSLNLLIKAVNMKRELEASLSGIKHSLLAENIVEEVFKEVQINYNNVLQVIQSKLDFYSITPQSLSNNHNLDGYLDKTQNSAENDKFISFYQQYSQFITASKNIYQLYQSISCFPNVQQVISKIKPFVIDKELNRQIELHFLFLANKPKQKQQQQQLDNITVLTQIECEDIGQLEIFANNQSKSKQSIPLLNQDHFDQVKEGESFKPICIIQQKSKNLNDEYENNSFIDKNIKHMELKKIMVKDSKEERIIRPITSQKQLKQEEMFKLVNSEFRIEKTNFSELQSHPLSFLRSTSIDEPRTKIKRPPFQDKLVKEEKDLKVLQSEGNKLIESKRSKLEEITTENNQ